MNTLNYRKSNHDLLAKLAGRSAFILSVLIFRAFLDISYIWFVSPVFSYSGFALAYSFDSYLYSWLTFFFVSLVTPYRLNRISDFFLLVGVLSVIAPLTSFYGLSGKSYYPVFISTLSIVGAYLLANLSFVKVPKVPFIKNGYRLAVLISAFMVLYLVAWYFISGAVRNFNLDFSKVYDYRELTEEVAGSGALVYLNGWTYRIFSLFLLVSFLYKKKYILFFGMFLIQIFFFAVSGHKSVFFYPFLIVGIYYYLRSTDRLLAIPVVFIVLIILCFSAYFFFDYITLASLFIRRVFFVPTLLAYDYFDFFGNHEKIYWSNSILSGIFSYPYDVRVAELIGEFNGSEVNANNGYVSSGYAHAGVFGVFIYTVVLGFILRFLDVISNYCGPLWISLALLVLPLRSLISSSDLFTVMLTHGLLVTIGLLLLIREKSYVRDKLHCFDKPTL